MKEENFDWANDMVDMEKVTCNIDNPEECTSCGS